MKNGIDKNETTAPAIAEPAQQEALASVLLLGGLSRVLPRLDEPLAADVAAQDLLLCALHDDDIKAAGSLAGIGADIVSLAGMRGENLAGVKTALGGVQSIGAGETESLACAPAVLCVNDVRIGVLAYSERRTGAFDRRADLLGLKAFEHLRMLLNRCDHVIVLLRAGLDDAPLPLPEWRARYRRFIDAGASVVADTGIAKGWEVYRNGLVLYGLGQPDGGNSLMLSLKLRQNGRFDYETRALEQGAGGLRYSEDAAFRTTIDNQNRLFLDEAAYLAAVDEMCLKYYSEYEQAHKRGFFSAILPGGGETARQQQERLYALLSSESQRLMTLRALAALRAGDKR